MTITATIAGAISMLAQFGMFFGGHRDNNGGPGIIGSIAMMILAPLGAMLVQMAISRSREYAADKLGARIVGQPMWLASALVKIDAAAHEIPNMEAERNPATAHMFIINPLSGRGSTICSRRIRRPRTGLPNWSGSLQNSVRAPTQRRRQVRNRLLDAVPWGALPIARRLAGPGVEREAPPLGPLVADDRLALIPKAQGLAKTHLVRGPGMGDRDFLQRLEIPTAQSRVCLRTHYRARSAEWLAGQMTPAGPCPSTVYLRLPPSAACFSAFSATSASDVGSLA